MKVKKSLGQNFLKCKWVSILMLKSASLSFEDVVLEIGPGKGALTEFLLKQSRKVIAYEKDSELFEYLKSKFAAEVVQGKLTLINKDILEISENELPNEYKLVANIPYYITGKIIRMFLGFNKKPKSITLLVQKEVAERIVSQKSSKLSLAVKLFAGAKLIKKVPKTCFVPQPKVDSAIVHLSIENPTLNHEFVHHFFEVLQLAFKSPRKKLINNLSVMCNKETLSKILEDLNIKETARAEDLTIDTWKKLVEKILCEAKRVKQ